MLRAAAVLLLLFAPSRADIVSFSIGETDNTCMFGAGTAISIGSDGRPACADCRCTLDSALSKCGEHIVAGGDSHHCKLFLPSTACLNASAMIQASLLSDHKVAAMELTYVGDGASPACLSDYAMAVNMSSYDSVGLLPGEKLATFVLNYENVVLKDDAHLALWDMDGETGGHRVLSTLSLVDCQLTEMVDSTEHMIFAEGLAQLHMDDVAISAVSVNASVIRLERVAQVIYSGSDSVISDVAVYADEGGGSLIQVVESDATNITLDCMFVPHLVVIDALCIVCVCLALRIVMTEMSAV